MHGKYSRRKILTALGISPLAIMAMDPITFIMKSVLSGIVDKAHAEAVNADDLVNYFCIYSDSGVPGWYWDLPLIPNGTDQFQGGKGINPFLGNKFINNYPDYDMSYATTQIDEFHLPHIWDANLDTTDGKQAMKSLANNMLMMRGISTGIDGHVINPILQAKPIAGKPSYMGLAADVSLAPFPSISLYPNDNVRNSFLSAKGISLAEIPRDKMGASLEYLIEPFKVYPGGGVGGDSSAMTEDLIGDLITNIKAQADKGNEVAQVIYKDRDNAINLLKKSFGDLKSIYTGLKGKYTKSINDSIRNNKVAGLEDQNVYWDANSKVDHQHKFGWSADLFIDSGINYNDPFTNKKNAQIYNMESVFATAEYLFTENVTSSIMGNINKMVFTYAKSIDQKLGTTKTDHTMYLGFDQHGVAYIPQTIYFHNYYKGLSAALYEFRKAMKLKSLASGGNLFDKTLVHLTSDFNRYPRGDGTGTDHGWKGSNVTLFGGMMDKLIVAGNIKVDSGDTKAPGTWGVGAPVAEFAGQVASLKNVASTICTLLKTKSISPNDLSFVRVVNGKAVSNLTKPRNIG